MVWNHISTDVIDVSIKITYTPIHEQLLTEKKEDQMHSLNVWNILYLQTLLWCTEMLIFKIHWNICG